MAYRAVQAFKGMKGDSSQDSIIGMDGGKVILGLGDLVGLAGAAGVSGHTR